MQERPGGKIYQKDTKDTILTSYHSLLSFNIINYSVVHEAILNERTQETGYPSGYLEYEPSQNTNVTD